VTEGFATLDVKSSTNLRDLTMKINDIVNESVWTKVYKHPVTGKTKKFSNPDMAKKWMSSVPASKPSKSDAAAEYAKKIIDYVISNSGDAIGEHPDGVPTVGDIIINTSDEFWDNYQNIYEPLINQIMKKEYGSNSIDDYLQQSHTEFWRAQAWRP